MRKLIFAPVLALLASPAPAAEFVGYAKDLPTLQNAFQSLGLWNGQSWSPIIAGKLSDGSGNFIMNVVGTVYEPTGQTTPCAGKGGTTHSCPVMAALTGYWWRLRLNGTNGFQTGALRIPSGLTVYSWQSTTLKGHAGCWANNATPTNCAATPAEPATSAQIEMIGLIQ